MSSTLEKSQITFNEFLELEKKLDIRMGQIVDAKRVPKSYGLELEVSFGTSGETKKAFTNLGKDHEPEALIGLIVPFILNLEPKEQKGVTVRWNKLLRKLGYQGAVDSKGKGIIHEAEPWQAVFFSGTFVKVVDFSLNKDYTIKMK